MEDIDDISEITMEYIHEKSLEIKKKKYIIVSKQLYEIIKVQDFFVSFVNEIFDFFNMGKWNLYEFTFGSDQYILIKIENNTIKNYFKLSMIKNEIRCHFSENQKKWINKCELILNLLNVSLEDKVLLVTMNNNIKLKLDIFDIKHIPNYNKHSYNDYKHFHNNILFNLIEMISTIDEKLNDDDFCYTKMYENINLIKIKLLKINKKFENQFSVIIEEFLKNLITICENIIC